MSIIFHCPFLSFPFFHFEKPLLDSSSDLPKADASNRKISEVHRQFKLSVSVALLVCLQKGGNSHEFPSPIMVRG